MADWLVSWQAVAIWVKFHLLKSSLQIKFLLCLPSIVTALLQSIQGCIFAFKVAVRGVKISGSYSFSCQSLLLNITVCM